MLPCYVQVKRADLVPAKKGKRNRTDWHLIQTLSYEDTLKLFTSLGGGPIETDLDFIQAVYNDNDCEPGIFSCVSGKKRRRGFWSFLLFVVFEDGSCKRFFRRNAFDKRRREKRNNIIAELRELQHNVPITDAAEIEKQIDEEVGNEMFDQMMNKIYIGGKRYGPFPYLRSTMRVEKFETLKLKKKKEPNFWGYDSHEKTEFELEQEEERRQADEEEQKRFADSFNIGVSQEEDDE